MKLHLDIQTRAARAILVLAVVLAMFVTSGWTAIRHQPPAPTDRSKALAAWREARMEGRPLPSPTAPAKRIAAYFAARSAPQREQLVLKHPLVVGNLNGAPVELRYQANRIAIRSTLAAERPRLKEDHLTLDGAEEAEKRVTQLSALLAADRQILAFDAAGDGQVAEVFGELDRAERVSVVIPGVDTKLTNFERIGKRNAESPVGMARDLYEAELAGAPAKRLAVIAWADYAAPAGIGLDAATGGPAEDGAVRLRNLVQALPGSPRTALFCHSYGSVVCGIAAHTLPAQVTDIAVAGSPGMRVRNRGQLHTRARVWAMRSESDWIGEVPHLEFAGLGHGTDPVDEDFGARVLSAEGVPGHGGYFRPDTVSLLNFAAIGTGNYTEVTCVSGSNECAGQRA